jgi:hypothetical protein
MEMPRIELGTSRTFVEHCDTIAALLQSGRSTTELHPHRCDNLLLCTQNVQRPHDHSCPCLVLGRVG